MAMMAQRKSRQKPGTIPTFEKAIGSVTIPTPITALIIVNIQYPTPSSPIPSPRPNLAERLTAAFSFSDTRRGVSSFWCIGASPISALAEITDNVQMLMLREWRSTRVLASSAAGGEERRHGAAAAAISRGCQRSCPRCR